MPKPAIDTKPLSPTKQFSPTEQALFAYLDDMLREGTETPESVVADTPVLVAESITENQVPEIVSDAAAIEASTIEATTIDAVSDSNAPDDNDENVRLPSVTGWTDNGRPAWAQTRFDALIFKVAGLKLAVPLVALGLIHPIDKKFNALPNQTPWFIGLLRVPGGAIKVIDTAMCVMPERYTPACREGLKYVITLHGYDWGLACHEVDKALCLEPDAINWRTQRGKRPWMAGTVRDHMCALIDSAGFHNVIAAVEQQKVASPHG